MAVSPPPPGTILSVTINKQTVTKQYFSEFVMLPNIQWKVIVGVENRRV